MKSEQAVLPNPYLEEEEEEEEEEEKCMEAVMAFFCTNLEFEESHEEPVLGQIIS
jgi:hypothetical protein